MESTAADNITVVNNNNTVNDATTYTASTPNILISTAEVNEFSFESATTPEENSDIAREQSFPETDADAALGFSPSPKSTNALFSSPGVKTSDIFNVSPHSSSLPVLTEDQSEQLDPRILKTLLDFVLDACKKLHVLYSDLDVKFDKNVRFLNEKLSTLHLLHQTTITESLRECRGERHELSVKVDQLSVSCEELDTKWSEQMELLKSNFPTDDDTSSNNSISTENNSVDNGALHTLDAEVVRLNESVSKLSGDLLQLDCRVVECEQYPRRNNIVISGIPDNVTHTHLKDKVYDVCEAIGLNLPDNSISACHRLPKGRNSPWPAKTIVRFVNREDADYCFWNRNKLKNRDVRNALNGLNLRIFENLCRSNNEVMQMCKWLYDNEYINGHFLRNGFVKIVIAEGDVPLKVKHPQLLRDRFPMIPHNLHML